MNTHQIKVNPGDTITISVEPCSKPAPLQQWVDRFDLSVHPDEVYTYTGSALVDEVNRVLSEKAASGELPPQSDTEQSVSDYAVALQRAIEYHCRGKQVPETIARQCPHHANLLNHHQPDTVDVEKLIEALSCEDVDGDSVLRGWPMVTSTGINATRRALAALHPRLKEEVER